MARPIKETPTLRGAEAQAFEYRMSHPKPVTQEAVDNARDTYNRVMSIAKFTF